MYIYVIVKCFVEVYGSHEIEDPQYVDPKMRIDSSYDLEEMNIRFKKIVELLKESIAGEQPKEKSEESKIDLETAATTIEKLQPKEQLSLSGDEEPGLTLVRTIPYQEDAIEIPHFLRDAFLLPQWFEESK